MNKNNPYYYCNVEGETNVGCKRKQNEDWLDTFESKNGLVAVVCDGMGGHVGGQVASHLAIDSIREFVCGNTFNDPNEMIVAACNIANHAILNRTAANPELTGMGSTCVMLVVRDGKVYVGSVGDSRVYLVRSKKIIQLTKDQSYVQMLVDMGEITREQAEHHPRRNEITNALGLPTMTPAVVLETPIVPEAGDCFLLCSDGLSGMVSDDVIARIVSNQAGKSQRDRVHTLIETACANGGNDNVTCQIVEFAVSPHGNKNEKKSLLWLWILLPVLFLTLAAAGAGAYFFLLDGTDSDVKKPHIEHEYTVGNDSLIKLPSSIKFKKGGPVFKITWKDTVYELTYKTEDKKVETVTLDGVKDLECMQIIGDFLSADTLKDGIAYKFTDKFKGGELFVKFDIEEKPRVYLFTINGAPAGKVAEKTGNTTAYMKVSDSSDDEPAAAATVAKALKDASGGDNSYDAEYSLGDEEVTCFKIKYTGAGYGGGKEDAGLTQERSPFKGGNSAAVDCGWYTYTVNGIECDVAVTNASVPTDKPYVRIPLEEGEYVVLLRINK